MPSGDLPNEYSGNQHECHLKRGGHAERVPQDARSRTEVCEHEPGEKNARCELPMASFRGSWRNQMVTKTKPTILAQLNTWPGSISAGSPHTSKSARGAAPWPTRMS